MMKLLVRLKPKKDESLVWYLYRLADANGFKSCEQLIRYIANKNNIRSGFFYANSKFLIECVAKAVGRSIDDFKTLIFEGDVKVDDGCVIRYVCRSCLSESEYLKKFIHLSHYKVCTIHKESLVGVGDSWNQARSLSSVYEFINFFNCDEDNGLIDDSIVRLSNYNLQVALGLVDHEIYKGITHAELCCLQCCLESIYRSIEDYYLQYDVIFNMGVDEFILNFLEAPFELAIRLKREFECLSVNCDNSLYLVMHFLGCGLDSNYRLRNSVVRSTYLPEREVFYEKYPVGILEHFLLDIFPDEEVEDLSTDLEAIEVVESFRRGVHSRARAFCVWQDKTRAVDED